MHSPEICLPGAGWEIAKLARVDIAPELDLAEPWLLNRAVIQKGESRMLVYYWFEQRGRKIAWDFAAKFWLMVDGITTGRTDGALVRRITSYNVCYTKLLRGRSAFSPYPSFTMRWR